MLLLSFRFALIVLFLYFIAFVTLNLKEYNESVRTQKDTVSAINITNIATEYHDHMGAAHTKVSSTSRIFRFATLLLLFNICTKVFNFIN